VKKVYRVYEGPRYHDFDEATIDKMQDLGLIRFYGSTVAGDNRVMRYHPAPRSRRVDGKVW
jgi:uncharacterized membrane-anchored protein